MNQHKDMKWSEVVRSIIKQQIDEMEEAERIASKSNLTERDVEELAMSVDKGVARRWKSEAGG